MKSIMLRCTSAGLAMVLGFALHAAEPTKTAEAPTPQPSGRVEVESELVDVGEVVRGQEAKATFVLKNTGTQVLKVLSAKPGCGCTVASFDETIPVGGTGKVTASVKTENFRGDIEKPVTITTDDPVRSTLTLRIKANVLGSVAVLPRPAFFLPSGRDWEDTGRIIVRKDPTETGELKLTDVSTTAPWLTVKTRKVESQEPPANGLPEALPGDWVLEVKIEDDAPKTRGGFQVKFKTGLPREPEFSVPVSIAFEQAMRVTPSPLVLPAPAAAGKDATGSLSVVLRPGLGKGKVAATASPESFTVRMEPDGERRYKATVRWKSDDVEAPRDGSVVFQVGEESLTVPVHVGEATAASLR